MAKVISARSLRRGIGTSYGMPSRIRPLWTVDLQDEEKLIGWLNETLTELAPSHNEMVEGHDRKREFYAGLQSMQPGRVGIPRDRERGDSQSTFSKLVVQRLYNIIELWVAKLTRFAPNVVVNPANNEYGDRVSAKLGKLIADNIAYVNDMDELLENVVRTSRIDGETFVLVEFDKKWGDYKAADTEAIAQRLPVIDSEGNEVVGVDDDPLYVEMRERIGEVRFRQVDSRFIFLEPKPTYRDADWAIHMEIKYVDELRAENPDVANDITGGDVGEFNFPWIKLADNEVLQFTIYHRSTDKWDSGCEIKCTPTKVLSVAPYSFRSCKNMLPFVRYSCIDLPGIQRGASIMDNLMVLQVIYNNIFSLAYTNISLAAHAYWLVPTQANVSLDKIRNSASVIKYTGPQGPDLKTFPTVGPEVWKSVEVLDGLITQISGHQGISQGDPPPGVDAAIALGVLEEQENQRANPEIKKYNTFIRKVYTLGLGRAQDNYKNDDGRLLRIVGKNNQDTMKAIDMSKFAGQYDVRVQRSTALSESKNLRLQQLMLMKQNWPDSISDERFLDLMELGDEGKFYDIVTASTRAAEAENEKFFGDEDVLEPAEFEHHLAHWNVHIPFINSLSFKEDVAPEVQQRMFDHILVHEMYLYDKCQKNLSLAQKLLTMDQFPKFAYLPVALNQIVLMLQNGADAKTQVDMVKQQIATGQGPTAPLGPGMPPASPEQTAPPEDPNAPPPTEAEQADPEEARAPLEAEQAPPSEAAGYRDGEEIKNAVLAIKDALANKQPTALPPINLQIEMKRGAMRGQIQRDANGNASFVASDE